MNEKNKSVNHLILRCKEGLLVHIIFSAISEVFEKYDLLDRAGVRIENISRYIAARYKPIERNITDNDVSLLSPYFTKYIEEGSEKDLLYFYEVLDNKTKAELEKTIMQEVKLNIIGFKRNINKRLDDLYNWIMYKS